MTNFGQSDIDRFWKYVSKGNEVDCWPWTGNTTHNGYGAICIKRKHLRAHRVAFLINCGEIPDGLWVLHTCDNRICCNPKHLWIGTAQDNIDDMISKGRAYHPKGSAHQCARMTESQVEEIKRLILAGVSTESVGERFKLGRKYVYQIATGQKWKHVLPELTPILTEKVAGKFLSDESRGEIRKQWSVDGVSGASLSGKYKVSPSTISRILKGIQRGHRVLSYA